MCREGEDFWEQVRAGGRRSEMLRCVLPSQREREIVEVICHFDNAHLLFPSKNVIILKVFGKFHFDSPRGASKSPWGVISVRRGAHD